MNVNRRMLVFLALCLGLSCLPVASAFATVPSTARVAINVRFSNGATVWQSYLDVRLQAGRTAVVKLPLWFYMRVVQFLGKFTMSVPFDKTKPFGMALLEFSLTSTVQPMKIFFVPQ